MPLGLAVVGIILAGSGVAHADSTRASLLVGAVVEPNCAVASGIGGSGAAAVTVQCTRGTPPPLGLDLARRESLTARGREWLLRLRAAPVATWAGSVTLTLNF